MPHQTGECVTRPFLRVYDRTPDTHGIPKNASGRVGIPPTKKKGCLRHQAINLASPTRVRDFGDGPLRLEECQSWQRYANERPPRHPCQETSANYCIHRCDTGDYIRAADITAVRNVPHLLDSAYQINLRSL